MIYQYPRWQYTVCNRFTILDSCILSREAVALKYFQRPTYDAHGVEPSIVRDLTQRFNVHVADGRSLFDYCKLSTSFCVEYFKSNL